MHARESAARSDRGGGAVPEVPRDYRGAGEPAPSGGDVVELFCERCADYRATVRRVSAAELPAAVAAACAERGVRRLGRRRRAARPRLEGLELVADDPPLGPRELDGFDGVLTGCALAIAETGTIVLDGGARSGRRAITLVPDYHVCVVEAARIVAGRPRRGRRARRGGRRRPPGHARLRPLRHQRHRAGPRGGRPRAAHARRLRRRGVGRTRRPPARPRRRPRASGR